MTTPFRIGTRASALALWQANWVKTELERKWPGLAVELVPIKTTGDKILNVPLSEVGGKGLFTKEIDEALAGRTSRCCRPQHERYSRSSCPMESTSVRSRNAKIRGMRLISNGRQIDDLPPAARIGTSSLRRQVQLRHRFPSVRITTLRGNVDTRLRKLADGEFDGIILALAGLRRLGHESVVTQILDETFMLPAIGQGASGHRLPQRGCSNDATGLLVWIMQPTRIAVTAERGLLAALEGSCKVPIAGHARLERAGSF